MSTETTVELPRQRGGDDGPAREFGRAPAQLSDALYRRPEDPDRNRFARLAREVIGVREEVLSWVPEERPRYTRLGIIVVNSGLMAVISLSTALSRVVSAPWPLLLPIALFWGMLVITLDSWMVASSQGVQGRSRWVTFALRLAMAMVLGFVIAEPLILWIFHPAIHANVEQYRQDQVKTERGLWTKCNPEDGQDTTGIAECRDYQLALDGTQASQLTLASLQEQRATLNEEYAALSEELDEKQSVAQAECAGREVGDQTSGAAGWGPLCEKAWQVAEEFKQQSDLSGKKERINSLDEEIAELTDQVGASQLSYAEAVAEGIDARVAEFEETFKRIDIIDEARGLERLSDQSSFVWFAKWLLRVLLILVDSLPVLAKMMSGTTFYDTLVVRQLRTGASFHEMRLEYAQHAETARIGAAIEEVDVCTRHDREQRDEDLEAEIDRRAQRYASEMR